MNSIDPENSLMPPHLGQVPPDQSLHTMGMASLTPDQLMAHTYAVLPPDFDPGESLHALGKKCKMLNSRIPTKTVHTRTCMYMHVLCICDYLVSLLNFTRWPLDSVPVVHHTSIANLPESPDYNTVLKMLKDVSHFLYKQFMFIIHISRALIPQYTVNVLMYS